MSVMRHLVWGLMFMASALQAEQAAVKPAAKPVIEVYRSQGCSCCGAWLEHMRAAQFDVKDHILEDNSAIKTRYGVTSELASCHTAVVNGYVVEGHVPASDIKRLLTDKPKVSGLTVPGMPVGTPGMEMGSKKDAYQVISFDKNHTTQVFHDYKAEQ